MMLMRLFLILRVVENMFTFSERCLLLNMKLWWLASSAYVFFLYLNLILYATYIFDVEVVKLAEFDTLEWPAELLQEKWSSRQ